MPRCPVSRLPLRRAAAPCWWRRRVPARPRAFRWCWPTSPGPGTRKSWCSSRAGWPPGRPRSGWRASWARPWRDGRPARALRLQTVAPHAHRARHRRRVHPADPRRPGADQRGGGAVRRVPRAFARCRPRPRACARRAAGPARGPAAAGHVGNDRRRACRCAVRRCSGDRERRPRLSGGDPSCRPRSALACRAAGCRCGRARAAGRSRLRAGLPAGRRRDSPHREPVERASRGPRDRRRCALWGAGHRVAGSRHRAGAASPPQGRAGDVDCRDLAHHRGRAHRRRQRACPRAALRAGRRAHAARNRTRLARERRPASRPCRTQRAGRVLPPVGRAADGFARALCAAGDPLSRLERVRARSRLLGCRRSGAARLSRFSAGACAQGGEGAAVEPRCDRPRWADHRGRQGIAAIAATAAARPHGGRCSGTSDRRHRRRDRRGADRTRARRRRRGSAASARGAAARPLAPCRRGPADGKSLGGHRPPSGHRPWIRIKPVRRIARFDWCHSGARLPGPHRA